MSNFSKYLGKDERVLNSIDMKDETVWAQNNVAAAEYKSWTTLVVTNKRFFSVSKRKLSMREFRLEDVVSTGWVYRPQWGKIIWGAIFLVLSALLFIISGTIADLIPVSSADAALIKTGIEVVAILVGIIAILILISYFLLKRTTFTVTTKDGREYSFLLRGRRRHIDDFRMTIQDAKDLYIEETENRYFDKMRTVLFDQSNYEYALNNSKPTLKGEEQPKLEKEDYMLWERKNAQLGESEIKMLAETTILLNTDGTLQLSTDSAYHLTADSAYLLENGGNTKEEDAGLKSSEISASGSLVDKASDLFKQMGFEVSEINAEDADLLLFKDQLRYIVLVDKKDETTITQTQIEKAIQSKNRYKTDFGLFISGGDLSKEIQEYANSNNIKIIYIRKAE
jgi:Restriction endonuclease.